jgi:D-glycero-D-manno-heptose 1,7-bisphosphate phosphatase
MKKAIFFDRDGVINDDRDYYYVTCADMFHINPGIIPLMRHIKKLGFLSIVITNQAGINKGLYSKDTVDQVHKKMIDILSAYTLGIDEVYYCPHHPEFTKCLCRKPGTLLIEKALSRFNIDPAQSYFIGDRDTDIEAGRNAGLRTIKVERNGNMDYLIEMIQ